MSTTIAPRKKNKPDEDCLDEPFKSSTSGVGAVTASQCRNTFHTSDVEADGEKEHGDNRKEAKLRPVQSE
ncbi:hypothetical protein ACH5RR_003902 [Cinchona calisaya]|uniref:Uncharacterized protein n=1 Tax=Cinchona calisaya TaxID=153742 RepID=A0ABD3AW80_9GENT